MVHSDWGDWLPSAVAAADPDGIACWYLGCNGFILKTSAGTTLFIDPYLGNGDPPRTVRMIPVPFDPRDVVEADAVLATHEHTDHVHGPSQAPIMAETGATFVGPRASIEVGETDWPERWDISAEQFRTVEPGDTFTLGDLEVSVYRANDPDADGPVAYAFEHDAGTFVHGGDARPGDFGRVANAHDVDMAALAFGSAGMIPDKHTREPVYTKWYNDENELIEAARELEVETLVPTHWDMWKGLTGDPHALHEHVRSFDLPSDLEIVEIGDRFDLG